MRGRGRSQSVVVVTSNTIMMIRIIHAAELVLVMVIAAETPPTIQGNRRSVAVAVQ